MSTQQQQGQRRRAPLTWDEIPTNPAEMPFMLLVEGEQGSGKTHLALTFPEPIFILDTENRADKVAAKFAGRKQVYRKRCHSFSDIRQTLLQLVFPHFNSGTVIIDSGSDLQRYAESEFLEEAKRDKIYPTVLWAKVFAKMDVLLSTLRDKGFYTVITARLRDEFVGTGDEARRSGERVLEGYKRLPYLVDVYLRLPGDGTARVFKNGFRNTPVERKEPLKNPSFQTILEELIGGQEPKIKPLERVQEQGREPKQEPKQEQEAKPEAKAEPSAHNEAGTEIVPDKSEPTAEEPENAPKDEASEAQRPAVPLEKREATFEEINAIYQYGRQMGLEVGSLQLLVHEVRGVDHTQGMTTEELARWLELICSMIDEYEVAK